MMIARTLSWISVVLLAVTSASPALAFVPRVGSTVVVTESIQDDLYLAGETVTTTSAVDGDVTAAGGTVELEGPVNGGVLAAGGTVRVGGTVGRSLRAAGGTLSVESQITSDAVIAGGTVTVGPAAQIGRDLIAAGGTVSLLGTVGRNARIGGGRVVVGGTIRGDAEVQASRIVLLPTAHVGGRLRYAADQPIEIQPGAEVAGGTERLPTPSRPRVPSPLAPGLRLWRALAEAVALLVLGLVAFGAAPRATFPVLNEVAEQFGRSLLAGFILVVVVPVAALLLLFTVVGIPLSAVMVLLYLTTLYPAQIFVAAWAGRQILQRVRRGAGKPPSVYWSLVVGTVVLVLLFAIPYGGWVIRLVALFVGFGALWVTAWGAMAARPTAPRAQSPAGA